MFKNHTLQSDSQYYPIITLSYNLQKRMKTRIPLITILIVIIALPKCISGFGSMGTISASFGQFGFFCAIDAGGKQDVICWPNNGSSSAGEFLSGQLPSMAALSGGEGFLCGILSNTSRPFCWTQSSLPDTHTLIPLMFRSNTYSHVASGKNHVCAIQGLYFSDDVSGTVDCWDIAETSGNRITDATGFMFDQYISNIVFRNIVSGEGFSCGEIREGGIMCWGPNTIVSSISEDYSALSSGRNSLCGISRSSDEVKCWGNVSGPTGIQFVSIAAGSDHFCGIRKEDHGIECWGVFNSSLVPRGSGFLAIASSDFVTCGIREDDLVLDCWFSTLSLKSDIDPPLELCSPGLCSSGDCSFGKFAFNASVLNEPDLTSLCARKDLKICSHCASSCPDGFFISSLCTENSDRVCTACSLCQNSSCWEICGILPRNPANHKHRLNFKRLAIIIGSSFSGLMLVLFVSCLIPRFVKTNERGLKRHFTSCIRKPKPEIENSANLESCPLSHSLSFRQVAQVFRISELKDATNGFKEFNELGRGSYGFVYKAVLPDRRQVAVKRANAATIIHTNSRDFEVELEILCKIRHGNIVNLLGYCLEMGERLLVYEYMPHGTLHDHLHNGLSPLNWSLRLKIAMQSAKGIAYLHDEDTGPIVHRDVKTSNILLDKDWVARVADFGLQTPNDTDVVLEMKGDIYNFGVVLLEILSGRKAYDQDLTPPDIVEWAVPLIRQGDVTAIIDRYISVPKNVEPLIKLADIAEVSVRENIRDRPNISILVTCLEQIAKEGLIL